VCGKRALFIAQVKGHFVFVLDHLQTEGKETPTECIPIENPFVGEFLAACRILMPLPTMPCEKEN
jgi:hypothetical protein